MLLSIACISASALFAFSLRKRKKLISALIAIESVVIIAMLAVTVLSTIEGGGTGSNVYLLLAARAICSKTTILGVSVSSLMLIQAIVVLLVCLISLYLICSVVKKAIKTKKPALKSERPADKIPAYNPDGFIKRKVFLLNCRLNN